ncbi:LysR substrate-binding domain-containing protein [Silvimonas amylolytica]|uniref:LysR family transcriptional regulator n=1 Tax=Silvimonas amylolytica TaxID=449663 RepID=A0ABQ2PML2_9NEIS|nr:LysR substrate-binding domain-containing protein [Silvimonas amylolytica]GGP26605.1 LysR family transcriptional regulator [Silvimonas amylolytica]
MKPRIPALPALRALETAARLHSFTRAAQELNVTHSAVSHHLRALEEELGTVLFNRSGPRMIPTPACERLAAAVRKSLEDLAEALDQARAQGAGVTYLQVSVMADFASAWLIRRLAAFAEQHPDIELMLRIHYQLEPPDPDSVDIGIWHRRINRKGYLCRKLLDDRVIAVASPALLARYPGYTLADVPRMPMLRWTMRSWRDWLTAAGLPPDEPERGPVFDDPGIMLQAAVAGQGLATARWRMARHDLENGNLVQIGDISIPASMEYFVAWRENHVREAAITRFYHWLNTQLENDAPAPGAPLNPATN